MSYTSDGTTINGQFTGFCFAGSNYNNKSVWRYLAKEDFAETFKTFLLLRLFLMHV